MNRRDEREKFDERQRLRDEPSRSGDALVKVLIGLAVFTCFSMVAILALKR